MTKLKRYLLYVNDGATIELPIGSIILDVSVHTGGPAVYVEVPEDQVETNPHTFHIIQANAEIKPGWVYRGKFFLAGDEHFVFEQWPDVCSDEFIGVAEWESQEIGSAVAAAVDKA